MGPPDDTALSSPALSLDGRQVAIARAPEGNFDVWIMDVARRIASRFTFEAAIDASPTWSPDGTRLIFRSMRNGKSDLFEKPVNGATDEQPVALFPMRLAIGGNVGIGGYLSRAQDAVAPDGRFLLNATKEDTGAAPITLVVNWPALLKR